MSILLVFTLFLWNFIEKLLTHYTIDSIIEVWKGGKKVINKLKKLDKLLGIVIKLLIKIAIIKEIISRILS
ncbi:hypothetical protein CLP_1669 [Clostridium butyricum E4 str. BoNT E BL5262]|uniref:Uncharacterized protein n=1 Tax=Clostridium butyricum E4 str. BoNT E BL5262 TaxID=632245 RepID=C4IFG5_CLOBU|nr:hypothetical protein CLP_1669 [Clostridium butyricum E4 str. BoNT E BL5262]